MAPIIYAVQCAGSGGWLRLMAANKAAARSGISAYVAHIHRPRMSDLPTVSCHCVKYGKPLAMQGNIAKSPLSRLQSLSDLAHNSSRVNHAKLAILSS